MKKIAIVTGSASGMGREIVREVNKNELDEIWLVDKNTEGLEQLKKELFIDTKILSMDLTDQNSIKEYVKMLEEYNPDVCLLANCAGYGKFGKIGEVPLDQELGMIRLNCEALTAITVTTLPYIKNGGKIINIASSAAHFPMPNFGIYSATKSYVLNFSRILHEELRDRNITVTALCPGPVDTGFFEVAESNGTFDIIHSLPKTTPKAEARKALKASEKGKSIATLGPVAISARIVGAIVPVSLLFLAMRKLK